MRKGVRHFCDQHGDHLLTHGTVLRYFGTNGTVPPNSFVTGTWCPGGRGRGRKTHGSRFSRRWEVSEAGQTSCCDTALNGGLGLDYSCNLDTLYLPAPSAVSLALSTCFISLLAYAFFDCMLDCLLDCLLDCSLARFHHRSSRGTLSPQPFSRAIGEPFDPQRNECAFCSSARCSLCRRGF